jgi:hypothetical protein
MMALLGSLSAAIDVAEMNIRLEAKSVLRIMIFETYQISAVTKKYSKY